MRSFALSLIAAALMGAAHAQPDDANVKTDMGSVEPMSYPVVITPTRLRQSLADVPASVSVIDASMLRRFGITSVPDALRLVPGMAVLQATGPDYRISYHGSNVLPPRRMNVLVDGISVYRPAFSLVDWKQLPVAIEDIDRIEVTRGPNSATYGPNSMLAIVNIITKNPKDVERGYVAAGFGSQRTATATARAAFLFGSTAVSMTAEHVGDRGYDFVSNSADGHDSTRLQRISLRSRTALTSTTSLDLQASLVRGVLDVPFADDYQTSNPDRRIEDAYLGGTWTHSLSPTHELQLKLNHSRQRVRQSWRSCVPTVGLLPEVFALYRANPAYAVAVLLGNMPSGGSPTDDLLAANAIVAIRALGARALAPTCAVANQDALETRSDIELQDTYVASEALRFVGGFGARDQRGESQTFLNGSTTSNVYWLFGNAEYRPVRWLTLNGGGYHEWHNRTGSTFSPRFAANVHVSPSQTLRFVVSRGTRSPDIQEQFADWTYTVKDVTPPLNGSTTARYYQSATALGNLRSERVTSFEAGYLLNLQRYGALLDVKVFEDKLTSLISERISIVGFGPTNTNAVTLRGAEVQASAQWSPVWTAFLNYAYLDQRNATTPLERTLYSRHSGSIGLHHDFGGGWASSLAYYGATGDGIDQSAYGRSDLMVSKSMSLSNSRVVASLSLKRLNNRTAGYSNGSATPLASSYNDRLQVYGQLSVRFP
jgi:iron complex outermembrane receptor protein